MSLETTKKPSRPGKSKRRVVRAAFVVTTGVVAVAAGCDGFTTTNPPEPYEGCPTTVPSDGSGCSEVDTCGYTDECGSPIEAECDGSTWTVSYYGTCNPPPPSCPAELPAEGEPCFPEEGGLPVDCSYQAVTACGTVTVPASCVSTPEGLAWQLVPPACTPPTEDCSLYADSALCGADTTCRWLVPGCGDPGGVTFQTGCYPAMDCTQLGCGLDEECTTVTYDPCWNSNCDACGAEADICLPTMGGA